jgi:hypothetical protein
MNKAWWEATPMRYDWREALAVTILQVIYRDRFDGDGIGFDCAKASAIRIAGSSASNGCRRYAIPVRQFRLYLELGCHSSLADTRRILTEMKRVLRSRGRATVMVYHRTWWAYYFSALLRGLFLGQLKTHGNLHRVAQAATDGAIARYYTPYEWRETSKGLFDIESIRIYGLKAEILPFPAGRLKRLFESLIPDAFCRLLTNRLRWGSFLVAEMRRAA